MEYGYPPLQYSGARRTVVRNGQGRELESNRNEDEKGRNLIVINCAFLGLGLGAL